MANLESKFLITKLCLPHMYPPYKYCIGISIFMGHRFYHRVSYPQKLYIYFIMVWYYKVLHAIFSVLLDFNTSNVDRHHRSSILSLSLVSHFQTAVFHFNVRLYSSVMSFTKVLDATQNSSIFTVPADPS